MVLPVGEIGEVIFADCFRQIFTGGGIQTFPRAQGFHVHQPEQNLTVETRRAEKIQKRDSIIQPKVDAPPAVRPS